MNQDSTEFNIKPNAGFSRRSWRWLLLILVVVSLGVALRLAWLGFWMILPFTVVELSLLILLMEMVKRRGSYIEKIVIHQEAVEIYHLERGKNRDWSFPLYWARVDLKKPAHHWYPHKLHVGSSGKWIEIGQCLTDEERISLADAIRREIMQLKSSVRPSHA